MHPLQNPQLPGSAGQNVLDRLLAGGVVLAGDITLRIADVDLVRIDLKAPISSVIDFGPLGSLPCTVGWRTGLPPSGPDTRAA
ncbi:gas vesicle protein [Streptomyces sp. NPDC060031]|uniref:gas vesicle protein n=1 Tax=Streptomyces sp. NPDC060031 TaxID=3347043 RepID=UPI0036ABF1A5